MPLRESATPNTPPEGPGILASICRKFGADPSILDLNAYRIKDDLAIERGVPNGRHLTYSEAEDLIAQHLTNCGDQDIFAFSGKITTMRWQEEIAKIVRKLQPDSFIVTGGGLATEIKEGLFGWIPELDAIGRSEGDNIITDILQDVKSLKAGISPEKISSSVGVINGKARFKYEGGRPSDLDEIPYAALDLLEKDPYGVNILEQYIKIPVWGVEANNSSAASFKTKRSLTTVSSRGCPYACTFCYRGAQGERNYGMRSPEHIARQVREYVDKYDLDFIGFPDDNFAVDKRRIKALVPVFKEYGLDKVRWGTHTRMDEADQRIFDMAESGCVYIGFGAESASPVTLEHMKKGGFILRNGLTPTEVHGKVYEFPTTMVNAIKNCRKSGIHGNCTWIMGYPQETLEDLKISVAFIKWQQEFWTEGLEKGTPEYQTMHDSVNRAMFTATAYPGTEMWKEVRPQLHEHFGINFDVLGNPICDDFFHQYILELDDATKILNNSKGEPVNYSAMPLDVFLEARGYIDNDELTKVLEM